MYTIKQRIIVFLSLSLLLTLLTACAATISKKGETVQNSERIQLHDGKAEESVWHTNDIAIFYTIRNTDNSLAIAGTIQIQESITNSFKLVQKLDIFLNFLDADGRVIESHNICPVIGFRTEAPESVPFTETLQKPPEAVSFAFSYWGKFRGAGADRYASDWEIYFNPVEKN